MARRLDARAPDFAAGFDALLHAKREIDQDVASVVKAIVADVRVRGDEAVAEYTRRFDKPEALGEAPSAEVLDAIDVAATRIEAYHRLQRPKDELYTDDTGATLGWRWTALDSVGLYVPGGTASYPSSVLMNAIPAHVAGVKRIAMVTPSANPVVMAAAKRAGITEVHRIGGAQAIAALAYGTQSIAAVDKIVGPGNAYVAAAKREVFGTVGIDSIAGPSEILVVSDGASNPDWIAADLLSQAEHDTSSQCILLTDDAAFADKVEQAVARALQSLPRSEIASKSWNDFGAVVVVKHLDDAATLVDRIAPEHLEIATGDPERIAARVRHAGAIFLGRHTPEAMGDYLAGPNHVLPTSRTARFSSGLSVLDFMKRTTLLSCAPGTLAKLGPSGIALARAEGLDAHARSIAVRLDGE